MPYEQLPVDDEAVFETEWGDFGHEDELGTIGRLTSERVLDAVRTVTRGQVFNLDYPINAFPPMGRGLRTNAKHTILQTGLLGRDDYLDSFFLQQSSHLDGLRHRRHELGFYNGVADEEVAEGKERLGVSRWAEHGIVGRGVLIDVAHYRKLSRNPLDHLAGEPFEVSLIDEVAAAEGVDFSPGDILLLRTGWAEFIFTSLTPEERVPLGIKVRSAGLAQSRNSLTWLRDRKFALVAADNPGVEALPPVANSPFIGEYEGLMHSHMIALLGLAVGELWQLDELAKDCAEDGRYEFLLVSKPLNLIGGVGSPANAVAIK